MEGEWSLADNRKNALWDGLHDESIINYHATEKPFSIEARLHLDKSEIKARHGPFSHHGQCNDLHALR